MALDTIMNMSMLPVECRPGMGLMVSIPYLVDVGVARVELFATPLSVASRESDYCSPWAAVTRMLGSIGSAADIAIDNSMADRLAGCTMLANPPFVASAYALLMELLPLLWARSCRVIAVRCKSSASQQGCPSAVRPTSTLESLSLAETSN